MQTLEVLERVKRGKCLAENTKVNYDRALKSLACYSEEWPVEAYVINEWLNSLSARYADETVRLYFRVGKAAANYIQKAGGRDEYGRFKVVNPFEDAEVPKVKHIERRYWDKGQLAGVVRSCRGESDLCLIGTLMTSVCRIGELPGLKGKDIKDTYFICVDGKTGERRYRLSVELAERLRKLAGSPGDYVFKRFGGGMISADGLAARVKRVVIRAGISGKKLGAHTIRHSMASLIAESTMSPLAVKAVLGHDDVSTSMRYIHDVEGRIQQRIDTVGLSGADVFSIRPDVERLALVDGEVVDAQDLIEDMFEIIPDGIGVRPLLRAKELLLLRSVMVGFSRGYRGDSRVYECQALLKRMLRKAVVKS